MGNPWSDSGGSGPPGKEEDLRDLQTKNLAPSGCRLSSNFCGIHVRGGTWGKKKMEARISAVRKKLRSSGLRGLDCQVCQRGDEEEREWGGRG